jgi:hypothetical protein
MQERPHSFRRMLQRSLDALQAEVPRLYAQLLEQMGAMVLRVELPDDRLAVRATGQQLIIDDPSLPPTVVLRLSSDATVLALADGEIGFLDALDDERMVLIGDVEDLVRFYETLVAYLKGGVRAPTFPKLLAAYRRGVEAGDDC